MKAPVLILCFSILPFCKQTKVQNKIVVLFYQQDALRPIGITEEEFWSYKIKFDTVELISQRMLLKIEKKIQLLKLTKLEDLSYQAALIRYKNERILDTIYTDRFFQYWKIDNHVYKDTSKFFEKLFVNFFDEQLQ